MIRFCHFTRSSVVIFNRFKFAAKVGLKHTFHVLRHFLQTITDLCSVRPNAVADQQFIEVRQMHQRRKALAQAYGIDQSKLDSTGCDIRQQTQQNRTHEIESGVAADPTV